jgi:hypothetical protein
MQALAARLISRLPHSRPGRLIVGAGLVLALLTIGVAAGAAVIDGTSDPAGPPATEVPADQVDAIARAALSCPTLTAARLAGQLMAASRFRLDATSPAGGSGVAGLTDAQWATWVPWTGAVRHDPAAETTALAHLMCSLAGQVREQGLAGDLWEPTLGAYRAGVAAVATAHGVPGSAADYVHTVTGYAAWYASHDPGTPSQPASPAPVPTGSATAPKPVPGDLVQLVVSAGRECPQITAARIAGQLMAASGFESDLRGTDGGQGIAQFLPTLWSRYAGAGQSPFAPATAIPTLGTAMCSLTSALNGLTDDPYPIALASFKDGPQISAPETTAGAGGDHFADQVVAYSAYYARDPRLAVAPASSSPAAGAAAGNTGANPAGATTDPVAAAPAAPGTPAPGASPCPPPPTAPSWRFAPVPAPATRNGPPAATAHCARGACAWIWPGARPTTGPRCRWPPATAARPSTSTSTARTTWSTRTSASASTWSTTRTPTAPGCSCGTAPVPPTRSGRRSEAHPPAGLR